MIRSPGASSRRARRREESSCPRAVSDPSWASTAHGAPPPREPAEVVELPRVDVRLELDVHGPEPPPVRELEGEVAALLPRPPAAEQALLAEPAREADEVVVPVVVAGDR